MPRYFSIDRTACMKMLQLHKLAALSIVTCPHGVRVLYVCSMCKLGRAMDQDCLSPRRSRFTPRSVRVGYVVDKVVLGQVFSSRVLRVSPVSIIPPRIPILIWEVNNRPVRHRSSETYSHPIERNNNTYKSVPKHT
jgi:hypothetical protein